MILPYPHRLLGLCLAVFFLVHMTSGLAVSLAAPLAVRFAGRLRARHAARFLFGLRLLPPAGALFAVAGLCVPSYLWLETEAGAERVGFAFLAAAFCAAAMWAISVVRGVRAVARSARYGRACHEAGVERLIPGERRPIWIVDAPVPAVVLAGIARPRVYVSRRLAEALAPDELAAALGHERAHQASCDNLKRLFLLLAPGVPPFHRGFEALEHGWAKFAEWAADDRASAGDPAVSLSLAAALVESARMNPGPPAPSLVTSLLGGHPDLAGRVERLLRPATPGEYSDRASALLAAAGCMMLAVALVAMSRPATFAALHRLLEHLVR